MHDRLQPLASVLLSGLVVWLMLQSTRGLMLSMPWWLYLVLLTGVWFAADYVVTAVVRYMKSRTL